MLGRPACSQPRGLLGEVPTSFQADGAAKDRSPDPCKESRVREATQPAQSGPRGRNEGGPTAPPGSLSARAPEGRGEGKLASQRRFNSSSAPGGGAARTTLDRAAGRGSGRRRRRHFPKVSAARSRRGWGPGVGAVGGPPAARGREAGCPFTSVASRLRAAPQASAPRPRVPAPPQPHPRSGRRGN